MKIRNTKTIQKKCDRCECRFITFHPATKYCNQCAIEVYKERKLESYVKRTIKWLEYVENYKGQKELEEQHEIDNEIKDMLHGGEIKGYAIGQVCGDDQLEEENKDKSKIKIEDDEEYYQDSFMQDLLSRISKSKYKPNY